MELGATVCLPRQPQCPICPVRKYCATQGEVSRPQPASRQKKKQIWCALHRRADAASGKIRLVQRPKKASLMPGMWELPQSSEPPHPLPTAALWRTFRHSITVTNYTVHVLRDMPLRDSPLRSVPLAPKGQWIAIDRIPQIPITGLTRKILKADGII
jgi:A/G-specific adenine glycosylase